MSIKIRKYLPVVLLLLPVLIFFVAPEKIKHDVISLIFGVTTLFIFPLGGLTLLLKIVISHFYKISWIDPISINYVKNYEGLARALILIVVVLQNLVAGLVCIMFSSFILMYFFGK